jgi:hypothetical protein
VLHMSGAGSGGTLNLDLVKYDDAGLRSLAAGWRDEMVKLSEARSLKKAMQVQENADGNTLGTLQNLNQRIVAFSAKTDGVVMKLASTQDHYRNITERMRETLAREQSIFGGGQALFARGQLSIGINQRAIEADQIHIAVQIALQDFTSNSGQILRDSDSARQGCVGAHIATSDDPVLPNREAWNAACLRFSDATREFDQRLASWRGAFEQIESVWAGERKEQNAIVQAAQGYAR